MKHSPQVARLIDALRALPGVGPKTAQRMAFHLLQGGRGGARALAEALTDGLDSIHRCNRGRYFVLHGHLSPLDGIGPEQIGAREFEALLDSGEVREVILATNPTVEGE